MKAYLRAQSLWSVLESDAEPTPLVANTTVAQRRQYDEEVAKKPWALTSSNSKKALSFLCFQTDKHLPTTSEEEQSTRTTKDDNGGSGNGIDNVSPLVPPLISDSTFFIHTGSGNGNVSRLLLPNRKKVFELCAEKNAIDELISLAIGPNKIANLYPMFMVNGFRFHTRARALGKKTQNSGVLVRGDDSYDSKEYYGVLEHVYELSYIGNRKVYLFKCTWWDVARLGRGYKIDKYGFVSVNTHCSLNTNEPFVLASQAEQVFYVKEIMNEDWLFVVKTSPRDLFNMPNGDELIWDEQVEASQQLQIESNVQSNDEIDVNEEVFEMNLHKMILSQKA
ncbi:hypothetical protein G2W53_010314 [Senna tora]|uniref:DUF4216 domain-containing protein n=1 Tax=Senna tora TaxID=362788 RepID=A0A835CBE4_9FABA|nr:hypothetical protein G2W53_010314 [Senna tora]